MSEFDPDKDCSCQPYSPCPLHDDISAPVRPPTTDLEALAAALPLAEATNSRTMICEVGLLRRILDYALAASGATLDDLGAAYVECQRLLIEAREQAGATLDAHRLLMPPHPGSGATLDVERLARALVMTQGANVLIARTLAEKVAAEYVRLGQQ